MGITTSAWRRAGLALAAAVALAIAARAPDATAEPDPLAGSLHEALNALQTAHPDAPGFAVALRFGDGRVVSAATGVADPSGTPMTSATPVRVASVTKTFVAAAALRLWEGGRLDLDAPLTTLISPAHDALLRSDGYDTHAITARHLAMHVSGLSDHVGDAFRAQIIENPQRVWTRTQQLELLVETSDPLGPPGEGFAYSDTGYVLLGEILERITGQPLHRVVREELGLATMSLGATWWDEAEAPADGAARRAHQYIDGVDIHDWHGSLDAFGGGGVVASMDDLTQVFTALFTGDVFDTPDALAVMTDAPGHPEPQAYRLGLFPRRIAGAAAYGHGGFWGIDAFYAPELDLAVAGVALDHAAYSSLKAVLRDIAVRAGGAQTASRAAVP